MPSLLRKCLKKVNCSRIDVRNTIKPPDELDGEGRVSAAGGIREKDGEVFMDRYGTMMDSSSFFSRRWLLGAAGKTAAAFWALPLLRLLPAASGAAKKSEQGHGKKVTVPRGEGRVLLKNGLVIDGTGARGYAGNVVIRGRRIEKVLRGDVEFGGKTVDCTGLVIAPGFIDVHSHADFAMPLADHARILQPLVMQGITTFVGGNCGTSGIHVSGTHQKEILGNLEAFAGRPSGKGPAWRNPAEYFEYVRRKGMLLNMAMLAGHGTLRIAVSGLETRLLTADEMRAMKRLLGESLEMGCLGMSTGLQYFPGSQSDTRELVECGRVLREHRGVFTSHLRSYSHTLDPALEEVFEVGRTCGVPVQVSHLYWQPYVKGFTEITKKAIRFLSYAYNTLKVPIPMERGLVPKLELIEKERKRGTDVHFDMVPTSQGFTELFAFLPPYALRGSRARTLERLGDRSFRKKVLHDIENVEPEWPHRDGATWSFNYLKMTGWNGLRVMSVASEKNRWMEGRTFPEIGERRGVQPFDAICDTLIEEKGQVMVFHTPTFPDDPLVFRSMWAGFTHPMSVPGTDTILRDIGRPSHVFYDCFPRFMDIFVKQKRLITWEEAVRKSTSLPAAIMNIRERGAVREGYFADLVVFDRKALSSTANFYEPRRFPGGIRHVMVNGRAVVTDGSFVKGVLAGEVVKRA